MGTENNMRPDRSTHGWDRDLSLKGVLIFGLGITVALILSALAMWWMSKALRDDLASADPAPSVLPEARAIHTPPGPQLQEDPEAELVALRAAEDEILTSYEWVDEANGVARIPVARAIEILAAEAQQAPEVADAEPVELP